MLDNNVSLDANLPVLRHKWTELERCFMTMEDMEPLTTALKIRYGASLTPIIGPPPFSFDTALKHLSEEPHGLLSSEEAHAITHFVAAVIASGEPRAGLPVKNSYLSTHSRLEANKNKPVTHIATCPTNPHSILYAVGCRDSNELGIYVLVYERVTLSQITRQGCTDVASLAESQARRGCKFALLCPNDAAPPQIPPTLSVTTSFRARDHTFTRDDYVSYVLTRDRLLLNASLTIAAFSYGGILYRLATESVQQYGLFDYDGSAEQYVTHQSSFVSIDNLPAMVHYSLTPSEIEIIVGAYRISIVSTANYFQSSSLTSSFRAAEAN